MFERCHRNRTLSKTLLVFFDKTIAFLLMRRSRLFALSLGATKSAVSLLKQRLFPGSMQKTCFRLSGAFSHWLSVAQMDTRKNYIT